MDYPGNLFVVAAPSGAGKSSLVKALLELDSHVQPSVSHTTRAPRGQEKDGREYYFVSNAEFDTMIAADGFVEWANVHGNRYGTSRKAIEERRSEEHTSELQSRRIISYAVFCLNLRIWFQSEAAQAMKGFRSSYKPGFELAVRYYNR